MEVRTFTSKTSSSLAFTFPHIRESCILGTLDWGSQAVDFKKSFRFLVSDPEVFPKNPSVNNQKIHPGRDSDIRGAFRNTITGKEGKLPPQTHKPFCHLRPVSWHQPASHSGIDNSGNPHSQPPHRAKPIEASEFGLDCPPAHIALRPSPLPPYLKARFCRNHRFLTLPLLPTFSNYVTSSSFAQSHTPHTLFTKL